MVTKTLRAKGFGSIWMGLGMGFLVTTELHTQLHEVQACTYPIDAASLGSNFSERTIPNRS